jgi:hypothetical protein
MFWRGNRTFDPISYNRQKSILTSKICMLSILGLVAVSLLTSVFLCPQIGATTLSCSCTWQFTTHILCTPVEIVPRQRMEMKIPRRHAPYYVKWWLTVTAICSLVNLLWLLLFRRMFVWVIEVTMACKLVPCLLITDKIKRLLFVVIAGGYWSQEWRDAAKLYNMLNNYWSMMKLLLG